MAHEHADGNGGHSQGRDPLARGLGWFSLGLGLAQVTAPGTIARMIGITPGGRQRAIMRAFGVREIATGVGIFSQPRPAEWLWARVAGDALDLAALGVAATGDDNKRTRVAGAMAAVMGVAVPDVIESMRLSRAGEDTADEGGPQHVRKSITVKPPPDEVYAYWRRLENLPSFMSHLESVQELDGTRSRWRAKAPLGRTVEWEAEVVEDRPGERISWHSLPDSDVNNSGNVRFVPAPGGRGTEVHVELRYEPPAGALGATLLKLFGEEPGTQVRDDLRRFKQIVETGEIVRSDGSPEGETLAQHLKQRPAQPRPEGATR